MRYVILAGTCRAARIGALATTWHRQHRTTLERNRAKPPRVGQ